MSGEFTIRLMLDPVRVILENTRRPGDPVTAILTIGGRLMPGQLSIDDTVGTAKVLFVDDKGDTDAAAPEGAQISYASDNPAVAIIDASTGQITPVAEGSANISAAITDASGNPVMEPDGVTAFSVPPAPVQVVAGQAVGAELSIKA